MSRTTSSFARFANRWTALALLSLLLVSMGAGCDENPPRFESGWIPGPQGPVWRSYAIRGGQVTYAGDILFDLDDLREFQDRVAGTLDSGVIPLSAVTIPDLRWPGAVVPYVLCGPDAPAAANCSEAPDFTDAQKKYIREAMNHWEQHTVIRFRESQGGERYTRIRNSGAECASPVGASFTGEITLPDKCFPNWDPSAPDPNTYTGELSRTIVHELGHRIGLWHEQQRADQAEHIEIHPENIQSCQDGSYYDADRCAYLTDQLVSHVELGEPGRDWGEYNFGSVMHYSGSQLGGQTIVPGRGLPTYHYFADRPWNMGGRSLSKGDVAAVNALYADLLVSPEGEAEGRTLEEKLARDYYGTTEYNSLSNRWMMNFGNLQVDPSTYLVGQFDGQAGDDIAAFMKGPFQSGWPGDVHVALSRFSSVAYLGIAIPLDHGAFEYDGVWHGLFCLDYERCLVADVDGDGLDDIVAINDNDVWVATSSGAGFNPSSRWHRAFYVGGGRGASDQFALADVDGDSRADLILTVGNLDRQVYVALSNGATFGDPYAPPVHWSSGYTPDPDGYILFGDLGKDRMADMVRISGSGSVFVRHSDGTRFGPEEQWSAGFCDGGAICRVADVDSDGRDDVVAMRPGEGHPLDRVRIGLSNGYAIDEGFRFHELDCRNPAGCQLADVDGDGWMDMVDPILIGEEPERDRWVNDVFVSLGACIVTDYPGPYRRTAWDVVSPGRAACGEPLREIQP
jgi:hypothetical protein